MGRKGEDFPLRSINDDVKMLESIHADLVSAPCSRYGKGKAVHLEVRSHAERGGDTQFHDSTVPIVSVNVGRLGGELIAVRIRGPLFQRGHGKRRAGAFQKLQGSIPDGQQERREPQVVDAQDAVYLHLHVLLQGSKIQGKAEEVFNMKPAHGEGPHGK